MQRKRAASRILLADGVLILIVALIHFIATPHVMKFLAEQVPAKTLGNVEPPFLLGFLLTGVLLVPLGISTVHASFGIARGERWARLVVGYNTAAFAALPILLAVVMRREFLHARLFALAVSLVVLVALSMVGALALARESPANQTEAAGAR